VRIFFQGDVRRFHAAINRFHFHDHRFTEKIAPSPAAREDEAMDFVVVIEVRGRRDAPDDGGICLG
jgi:hypothetical protein